MRTVRRLDQVIPTLASRDAIGQHTVRLRDVIRRMGLESDIFYANATTDVTGEARPLDQLGDHGADDRVLLYQLSIGSPVAEVFARRREPKLVNYHNITPAELLSPWEPPVGDEVRAGRAELARLAAVTEFAFADSAYNEAELVDAGYRRTAVADLLIDYEAIDADPDPATARRLADERAGGGADLLFVGKLGPHKAAHDLVKALAAYRKLYDPRARLHLVGGDLGTSYPAAVARFAADLGLRDVVDLAGSVDHRQLVAYYRACDVFVCLSDHEGFCVPLVEAMVHRLPIVAFASSAVPDTVGRAGVVLPSKAPLTVAAAIDRVRRDDALRAELAAGAEERVASLSLARTEAHMTRVLQQALDAVGDANCRQPLNEPVAAGRPSRRHDAPA